MLLACRLGMPFAPSMLGERLCQNVRPQVGSGLRCYRVNYLQFISGTKGRINAGRMPTVFSR